MSPITFSKPKRNYLSMKRSRQQMKAILSTVGAVVLVSLLLAGVCAAISRKLFA